jgi:predicted RNA binding protein YcfA (HicA-like mRNA interferase family)
VPKLSGVNHLQAIRALEKAGLKIIRQGKHVILTDGTRTLVVPRNNPINPFTMGYRKRIGHDHRSVSAVAVINARGFTPDRPLDSVEWNA